MTGSVALAVWSVKFQNDLPDGAFLHIEAGGEKDEDGKTKPRSLRHFPYKDSSGAIDLPHLRNAIAQAPKSNLSEDVIKRVQSKGQKLLEKEKEKMQQSSDATDRRSAALALDVSFDDIRRALQAALEERYPEDDGRVRVWVQDVFDTTVIYELDSELWRLGYTYTNGEATLVGKAERVRKAYEPVGTAATDVLTAELVAEDTLTLAFDLPAGADPPTSFRLFPRGKTRTTKGDLVFDDKSAESVMGAMADHGKADLPIDYAHGMLSVVTTPDSGKAAGWFKPTTPGGELWASDIQWTPAADKALRNREYRYHSPAVKFDRETRRVTQLINVALTNLHATRGLRPLVASETEAAPGPGADEEQSPMASKLLHILGAHDEAEAVIIATEHDKWTKDVLAAAEATNLDGALAGIAALKQSVADEKAGTLKLAAQVSELSAKVDKSEKDEADRKKKALIAELSEAGKLPPALHKWAEGESFEQLTKFGELAEVSDKATTTTPKPPASADPEVTPQMEKLASQTGTPIEQVKETLKLHAAEAATK